MSRDAADFTTLQRAYLCCRPKDPEGLYAALGLPPGAAPEACRRAFQQKVRLLHPDNRGLRLLLTGFVRF